LATVEEALQSQVRNIEQRYGRSMDDWLGLIQAAGLARHAEILAWLKTQHSMTHGDANRVALVVRDKIASADQRTQGAGADPLDELYSGRKAVMRPLHDRLVGVIDRLGDDVEYAAKRGYVSVRRRKQFAMLQPASTRVDVGLILKDAPVYGRLEAGATFNAMFTHRVRVEAADDVDPQLEGWLHQAYDGAG